MHLDLTGEKYGRLTVVSEAEPHYTSGGRKLIMWNCKCDCGGTVVVSTSHLRSGHTVSCGCRLKETQSGQTLVDITGQRFGRLVVLGRNMEKQGENRHLMWDCICDCGNRTTVSGLHLKDGHTKSCGCLAAESLRTRSITHGKSKTALYHVFLTMHSRCDNPNTKSYHRYGGRGIKVCDEWRRASGFQAFYDWAMRNGYQEGLTIDRIDTDGDYEPSNCRWVTHKVQNNNRKNNRLIEYDGNTYTLSELSEISVVEYTTLQNRLNVGWDVETAINTPVNCRQA